MPVLYPMGVFAAVFPALTFPCKHMERQRGMLFLLQAFSHMHVEGQGGSRTEPYHQIYCNLLQMGVLVSWTIVILTELNFRSPSMGPSTELTRIPSPHHGLLGKLPGWRYSGRAETRDSLYHYLCVLPFLVVCPYDVSLVWKRNKAINLNYQWLIQYG